MSVNPIENNPTPKTTGSLEELFRHHLGEEAAVPPRPMLWDQVDNSLLVRQNEIYRKRLAATRWVAAASLLLATLAGTGWWARRDASQGGSDVAGVSQSARADLNARTRIAPDRIAAQGSPATVARLGDGLTETGGDAAGHLATGATRLANSSTATSAAVAAQAAARATAFGPAGAAPRVGNLQGLNAKSLASQGHLSYPARRVVLGAGAGSGTALAARGAQAAAPEAGISNFGGLSPAARLEPIGQDVVAMTAVATPIVAGDDTSVRGTATMAATGNTGVASGSNASVAIAAAPVQVAVLLTQPATLPNGLATLALPDAAPLTADAHHWHYGASYSASVFNPNINFSRAGIESEYDYNHAPGFGPQSPALTETAASQYREHLRPGLSQRIALLASRHLTGHWSLRTGAEYTQATAQSATSLSFVGEQLPDVGQSTSSPLHTTRFRYQLASIPVEVRYDNPVKRGWSLYGRLGGVVSALLGARSDVAGNPEATRTYSIASNGMPYRRVLGSVRGGVGAQFRTPTGKWAFSLGPVAELGLVSMNAHPVQRFFTQSRPYSFGVEAGMEFGR